MVCIVCTCVCIERNPEQEEASPAFPTAFVRTCFCIPVCCRCLDCIDNSRVDVHTGVSLQSS